MSIYVSGLFSDITNNHNVLITVVLISQCSICIISIFPSYHSQAFLCLLEQCSVFNPYSLITEFLSFRGLSYWLIFLLVMSHIPLILCMMVIFDWMPNIMSFSWLVAALHDISLNSVGFCLCRVKLLGFSWIIMSHLFVRLGPEKALI